MIHGSGSHKNRASAAGRIDHRSGDGFSCAIADTVAKRVVSVRFQNLLVSYATVVPMDGNLIADNE